MQTKNVYATLLTFPYDLHLQNLNQTHCTTFFKICVHRNEITNHYYLFKKKSIKMFDPCICVCPRTMKYRYRPGTTPILTDKVVPLKLEVVKETVQQMEMA